MSGRAPTAGRLPHILYLGGFWIVSELFAKLKEKAGQMSHDPKKLNDALGGLQAACSIAMSATLKSDHAPRLSKCFAFLNDLNAWAEVIKDRPEVCLHKTASAEYTLALFNLSQSQYRNSFKGLRLVLELILQATYSSTHLLELKEWLVGGRHTSWARIMHANEGLFGKRVCYAFFDELSEEAASYRSISETLYTELSDIKRLNILFDEAAHIFRPEQQRQFFTLFRDLRSPYMTCNAAVYPGVTAYGAVFETMHDARVATLNREVLDSGYRLQMRDIVIRQATSELQRDIEGNGQNFDALAYSVSGNPRLLLKAVALAPKVRSSEVQSVIKDMFRTTIWSEHSGLAGRYPGHKEFIDWGRSFIEETVISDLQRRNETWQREERSECTNIIWLHKDAPAAVQEAFRLLTYTGIISKLDDGIVATRGQIGSRYALSIGCLVAPAANPISAAIDLVKGLTVRRFVEYGSNHPQFVDVSKKVGAGVEADVSVGLSQLLKEPVSTLDISTHQMNALASIGIKTIADALNSDEATFQRAYYVGPVRSRRIMNVVTTAVLEYLSG
jgi:hypothetical protein